MGLGTDPNGPGRDPQWAWGEIPAVKPGCALGEAAWVGGSGVQCVLLGSEDRVMGGGGREADCRSWKESSFPGVPTVFKWTGSPGPWRHPGLGIRLGTEEEGLGQKHANRASSLSCLSRCCFRSRAAVSACSSAAASSSLDGGDSEAWVRSESARTRHVALPTCGLGAQAAAARGVSDFL